MPTVLALLLLAAPSPCPSTPVAGDSGAAVDAPVLESGAVVAYEIPDRPGARHEYFALREDGECAGVAAVHVGPMGDAMRAEMRFDWFEIGTRVMHVERLTSAGPRLVWREFRLRSGRTVLVEWGVEGERLTSVDWSGRDAIRRQETPRSGALLPLFLIDRVREGQFPRGCFDIFDPVSRRIEEWSVEVRRRRFLPTGPRLARQLVLSRSDGSLAGEYWFVDQELVAFRLQRGGAVAVRIPLEEYERLLEADRGRQRDALDAKRPSPASAPGLGSR